MLHYEENNTLTDKLYPHKRDEFKDIYENFCYEKLNEDGTKTDDNFVIRWFKDKSIRTYEELSFYPQRQTPPYIYNTFRGFDGAKAPNNNNDFRNSYMYQHLKNNICCNDEQKEEYLTKRIANVLRDPLNKTTTAMVLQSRTGTGKDIFIKFLNLLIGDNYFVKTSDTQQIFGRFNTLAENKVLCMFNETQGKDTYEIEQKNKDAIARDKINVEHKGKCILTVNDATHYIFFI